MRTRLSACSGLLAAALLLVTGSAASAQTYPQVFDNGPFITLPGGGFNGGDLSQQEAGTVISLGINAAAASWPKVADDFVIEAPGPVQQRLARIKFYGVQTQTANFTTNVNFTALYITIYDGNPSLGANIIAGDQTTNRLISSAWTGAYRIGTGTTPIALANNQRPITELTADMTWAPRLPNGEYWFVISGRGDTVIAASPNPQTILVTPRLPGSNGVQQNNNSWVATADYPFKLLGVCPGDYNANGMVSVQDIFDFLTDWFASSAAADVNGQNGTSVQDIFDFLSAWFEGC